MKFQPEKILSINDLESIVYDSVGLDDNIVIGQFSIEQQPLLFVKFMETWVKRIDQIISFLEKENSLLLNTYKAQLILERGFTYSEYARLFDTSLEEADFVHFPAFYFLQITSDKLRKNFIYSLSTDARDYVQILRKINLTAFTFLSKKLDAIISYNDLKRHCYISGKSGSGKSELIKTMFYNLQKRSQTDRSLSLILIDPHGDLADDIKRFHLNSDMGRFIFINPSIYPGYTPTFNPFDITDKSEYNIDITSQFFVNVFNESITDTTLSSQMAVLLNPCIATLLRMENASLSDLQEFMNDSANAHLVELGKQSSKPSHSEFFSKYFYDPTYKRTKSSLMTKIQGLLNSDAFYNLVTGHSTVNLDQAMDEGKVIVFSLGKGNIGIEASETFGRFLIATIQSIAQKRAQIKDKSKRKDTFLFIDEAQNFLTSSIEIILKEARKFSLHLIVANQTIGDFSEKIETNLLNNTEIKIIGRNGAETLKILGRETGIDLEKLLEMKRFEFYVKSSDRAPFLFHTSDMLRDPHFQLNEDELTALDKYLEEESGYYKPIPKKERFETADKNTNIPSPTEKDSPKPKFDL